MVADTPTTPTYYILCPTCKKKLCPKCSGTYKTGPEVSSDVHTDDKQEHLDDHEHGEDDHQKGRDQREEPEAKKDRKHRDEKDQEKDQEKDSQERPKSREHRGDKDRHKDRDPKDSREHRGRHHCEKARTPGGRDRIQKVPHVCKPEREGEDSAEAVEEPKQVETPQEPRRVIASKERRGKGRPKDRGPKEKKERKSSKDRDSKERPHDKKENRGGSDEREGSHEQKERKDGSNEKMHPRDPDDDAHKEYKASKEKRTPSNPPPTDKKHKLSYQSDSGSEYTSATGSYSCSSNLDRSDKLRAGKPRMYNIYPNVIMVLRETERLDDFFPNWTKKVGKEYRPYDLNMPMALPIQRPVEAYEDDPPITNTGDVLARMIGRGMYSTAYVPDIIYSSPSLRCLQTAQAVKLITKSHAHIRVEPGLFECMSEHPNGPPQFPTPEQRAMFSVDENYRAHSKIEDLEKLRKESYMDYNSRVRNTLMRIAKMHEVSNKKKDQLVLIVGHASTVDLAAGHMAKKSRISNESDLKAAPSKIPHGSLLILERIEGRRGWTPNLYAVPPVNYTGLTTQFDIEHVLREVPPEAAQ